MAVTIAYGGTSSATTNSTFYRSSSCAAQVGELLAVFVAASGTVQRPGIVTTSNQPLGGSTFTLVTTALWGASGNSLYAYVQDGFCTSSGTGNSTWVGWDCVGDAATGAIINVVRLQGMSKVSAGAVRQYDVSSNQGTSTRPLVTFSSISFVTSAIISCVATNSSMTGLSPPGGFTEYAEGGYTTPLTGMSIAGNVGSNSTAIRWGTSTSSLNCCLAVEFFADAPLEMNITSAMLQYQYNY